MHPGPMNRGIEISSDIADGPNSGILTQVTNGLAVRMAVLYLVTQAGDEMASILIKNGTILDPSQNLEKRADLLIDGGRIAAIGPNLGLGDADRVIDAPAATSRPA
jgi:hypothetical protein